MSFIKNLFSPKPNTIYRSIAEGNLDEIKAYLTSGNDISADFETEDILHYAIDNCAENYDEVVRYLINNYGDIERKQSKSLETLLHKLCARATPNLGLIRLLLDKGADPNAKNSSGRTPLFYCTLNFSAELLRLLAEYGADVKITDKYGNTVLHDDLQDLNPEHFENFLTALLDLGFDINARNRQGYTPLKYCKNTNFADILKKHGGIIPEEG